VRGRPAYLPSNVMVREVVYRVKKRVFVILRYIISFLIGLLVMVLTSHKAM